MKATGCAHLLEVGRAGALGLGAPPAASVALHMRSVNANSTTAASSASASAPNLRYALGTQEAGALGSSNASRQQRQQQASTKLALSATLCGLCFAAAFGVSHQHRGGRGTSAGTTMDAHAHHHHDAAAAAGAAAGAVGAMDDMAPMPMYFVSEHGGRPPAGMTWRERRRAAGAPSPQAQPRAPAPQTPCAPQLQILAASRAAPHGHQRAAPPSFSAVPPHAECR